MSIFRSSTRTKLSLSFFCAVLPSAVPTWRIACHQTRPHQTRHTVVHLLYTWCGQEDRFKKCLFRWLFEFPKPAIGWDPTSLLWFTCTQQKVLWPGSLMRVWRTAASWTMLFSFIWFSLLDTSSTFSGSVLAKVTSNWWRWNWGSWGIWVVYLEPPRLLTQGMGVTQAALASTSSLQWLRQEWMGCSTHP